MALLKKYNSIKKIVDQLDYEVGYMQGALEHIELWTDRYQEENNHKPIFRGAFDLSLDHSANTLHSDLNEGIQLVKKLIEITKRKNVHR